jgi:hypothetical protein
VSAVQFRRFDASTPESGPDGRLYSPSDRGVNRRGVRRIAQHDITARSSATLLFIADASL